MVFIFHNIQNIKYSFFYGYLICIFVQRKKLINPPKIKLMKKEILISSDSNYDNLVAEIYIDDKYIALVSYDEGHNFFVETPTTNRSYKEIITHKVEYNTFIELLEEAKNSLK